MNAEPSRIMKNEIEAQCLVAVHVGLVRSLDSETEVVCLLRRELGEFDAFFGQK